MLLIMTYTYHIHSSCEPKKSTGIWKGYDANYLINRVNFSNFFGMELEATLTDDR